MMFASYKLQACIEKLLMVICFDRIEVKRISNLTFLEKKLSFVHALVDDFS
jgi:hypothetical protein